MAAAAGPVRKKARVDEALDAGTLYTQVWSQSSAQCVMLPGTQTRAKVMSKVILFLSQPCALSTRLLCPGSTSVAHHAQQWEVCMSADDPASTHVGVLLQAESLTKEAAELEAAIAAEVRLRTGEQGDGAATPAAAAAAAPAVAAAADTSATANGSAAGSSAAADSQQPADCAAITGSAASAAAAQASEPEADALDAFMHDMAEQAEADKVSNRFQAVICNARCPAGASVYINSWTSLQQLGVVCSVLSHGSNDNAVPRRTRRWCRCGSSWRRCSGS